MTQDAIDLERLNRQTKIREGRCEFMDLDTREVWQPFEPVSKQWYEGVELEPGWARVGYGAGFMDRAWFRRSPGDAQDGRVRTREIDGETFFCCAKPIGQGPDGDPPKLMVDKHHSLGFDAGRVIPILESPCADTFVLVVAQKPDATAPKLPDGWTLYGIQLQQDWRIDLPAPTETYWLDTFSMSFQGPVALPETSSRLVEVDQATFGLPSA